MQEVFKRVALWNAARYEQVYNHGLALSLLQEEYNEWRDAQTPVDKLDALCDMIYVAIGVLWKNKEQVEQREAQAVHAMQIIDNLIELNELNPAYFMSTFIDVFEDCEDYPVEVSMHLIITASLAQMFSMGLDFEQAVEALLIVCDANDSKTIKKTAPGVKANVDKGEFFVPPEAKLTKLLERVKCL